MSSNLTPQQWREVEEKRRQYGLESGKPNDFASPGGGVTGRRSVKKKWDNKGGEDTVYRCDEWLSPPSDALKLVSPGGTQKRRSYTIKGEIPAPNLD